MSIYGNKKSISMKKKYTDCIARLNVDSPAYYFVQALRSIHKQKGKYDFVNLNDILALLSESHRTIINDPENGVLDTLMRMQIIEQNLANDLKFQIHPDHWISFDTTPEWFSSGFFCLLWIDKNIWYHHSLSLVILSWSSEKKRLPSMYEEF